MREIEFRGKIPDWKKMDDFVIPIQSTEWVYGDLIQDPFQIMDECQFSKDENPYLFSTIRQKDSIHVAVIAETISQYTGLNDKNGKKIFEGDIIRTTDNSFNISKEEMRGVVTWSRGGFIGYRRGKAQDIGLLSSDLEIIGNQHDNPELLR